MLSENQLKSIERYIMRNGREIEKAKWNYLFNSGEKEAILSELLKYQNRDGGFGNGLEADILMPNSSSIASAEAILIAYDYHLDCGQKWFRDLLDYLESTIANDNEIVSFWEKVPNEVDDYPHAPWWNYSKEVRFTPNPCAVIASAFLKYGSAAQKQTGNKIAARCLDFLKSEETCSEHDCYCLQTLIQTLKELKLGLLDDESRKRMDRRILECLCTDSKKWTEYVAQPLDLISTPKSPWYELLAPYLQQNLDYWLDSLKEEGFWQPNFSWGIESQISRQATVNWQCYIAVKRARILRDFQK